MFERLRLVGETVDHNYRLAVTRVELGDALGISEVYANCMLRRREALAHPPPANNAALAFHLALTGSRIRSSESGSRLTWINSVRHAAREDRAS